MINIHSKLVKDDLRKIGVDAFAVLICITSHLNKKRTAWPGIERLRTMTGLSRERAYKAIKTLTDGGYIEKQQRNQNGQFGNIVYTVTTKYLSVFVSADNFELEEEIPLSEKPYDGNPYYGNASNGNPSYISIDKEGSISKVESINKVEATKTKKSSLSPGGENPPLTNKKGEERQDAPRCASDTPPPASLPDTPEQRLTIAQAMIAHAKGEGAEQWQFMCTAQGYTGTPEAILSIWASKATPYQLSNWRKEFNKLHYWLRNEARARKGGAGAGAQDDIKFI